MREQAAGADQAVVEQPLERVLPAAVLAHLAVGRPLGQVHVHADAVGVAQPRQGAQRVVLERETGVGADQAAEARHAAVRPVGDPAQVAVVLLEGHVAAARSGAVGHLVAEAGAQADEVDPLLDAVERAADAR